MIGKRWSYLVIALCVVTISLVGMLAYSGEHTYKAPKEWGMIVSVQTYFWGTTVVAFENGTIAVYKRNGETKEILKRIKS